jgi:hypothetical protein
MRLFSRRAWTRYEHLNTRFPIVVRGTVGIGLFLVSDVLAQRTERMWQPLPSPRPFTLAHDDDGGGNVHSACAKSTTARPHIGAAASDTANDDAFVAPLAQTLTTPSTPPTPPTPSTPSTPSTPPTPSTPSWGYDDWDPMRSLRTCSWRAAVWAPTAHYFWLALETYVTPAVAHLGTRGVVIKILCDFATVTPPLVYSFLVWSKCWETRGDVAATLDHANARLPQTLLAVYCFWTPLHFFTYGLVPVRHRVAWVSVCSLGFGSLMSVCNNSTELSVFSMLNSNDDHG